MPHLMLEIKSQITANTKNRWVTVHLDVPGISYLNFWESYIITRPIHDECSITFQTYYYY